jgi:peroxiredoxin
MQELQKQYGAHGLVIIAVNVDRDHAEAQRFLSRFHPQFEIRFDPQGALAEQYNVVGMPTSIVFDRKGVARFTHVGFRPVDEALYGQEIQALLSEQ